MYLQQTYLNLNYGLLANNDKPNLRIPYCGIVYAFDVYQQLRSFYEQQVDITTLIEANHWEETPKGLGVNNATHTS